MLLSGLCWRTLMPLGIAAQFLFPQFTNPCFRTGKLGDQGQRITLALFPQKKKPKPKSRRNSPSPTPPPQKKNTTPSPQKNPSKYTKTNQQPTFQQAAEAVCMFLQCRYHFFNSDFIVCISEPRGAHLNTQIF